MSSSNTHWPLPSTSGGVGSPPSTTAPGPGDRLHRDPVHAHVDRCAALAEQRQLERPRPARGDDDERALGDVAVRQEAAAALRDADRARRPARARDRRLSLPAPGASASFVPSRTTVAGATTSSRSRGAPVASSTRPSLSRSVPDDGAGRHRARRSVERDHVGDRAVPEERARVGRPRPVVRGQQRHVLGVGVVDP